MSQLQYLKSKLPITNYQLPSSPPGLRASVVQFLRPSCLRVFVVASLALLSACESDFVTDPDRPRPARALESPYGMSDPNHEVMVSPSGATPLLTIDIPNNKNEQPVVHTIADTFTTPRPAASQPAASQSAPAAVNDEIKISAQQRPADQFRLTRDNEANLDLWILCPTGIGTVTLERAADNWPALIRVHLRYDPNKEFSRLEGFSAAELTAAGGKVPLKTTSDKETAQAQVAIPGFSRAARIQIEWVDMYR